MHVYISADMEGIAGVSTLQQTVPGSRGYDSACRLMTNEINLAVAGAFDAGAEHVLVNDSHGPMDNVDYSLLDPRAELLQGKPKVGGMSAGLDSAYDVAFLIGYHSPAGQRGILSHTYTFAFQRVLLNDEIVSEAELVGLVCASHGVPVGLVTGDDQICELAETVFSGTQTVRVKRSHGQHSATHSARSAVDQSIRRAARDATANAHRCDPVRIPECLELAVEFSKPHEAELASKLPNAELIDRSVVRVVLSEPTLLMEVLSLWATVCAD